MVHFPDADEENDPPNRRNSADSEGIHPFLTRLAETVWKELQDSSRVEVWFDGENYRVRPVERAIERHRTDGPPSTDPHRGIEQTEGNRKTASSRLSTDQRSNREGALSTQVDRESGPSNGSSNVRSLTEKEAKAFLLLEQTGGEISVGDLAEEVGYASKSSAHNAKEKWHEDRGLASEG